MTEGTKTKKMIAIKRLQSLTVYWFYYISFYSQANKNKHCAIKIIWSEQIVVELLTAAHAFSHLTLESVQREALDCVTPSSDPVKGPCPPSADRWQERKWRRPAAAPFTPGDRSNPSSQPRWTLLCCPYGHVKRALQCCRVLPQRS